MSNPACLVVKTLIKLNGRVRFCKIKVAYKFKCLEENPVFNPNNKLVFNPLTMIDSSIWKLKAERKGIK